MTSSLQAEIIKLNQQVELAAQTLQLTAKQQQLADYQLQMQQPDFWQDSQHAQLVSQSAGQLEKQIQPWLDLIAGVDELKELASMSDESLKGELEKNLTQLKQTYTKLEPELKFTGKFDNHNAIVTIQAGAGGTDAQDWAQILLRLYVRWAESHGFKAIMLDETPGEEAGIKNATLSIEGDRVYGRLRSEHGVHRLVRLSPFNSSGTRETSFAMVEVVPQIDEPAELELDEQDLKIDVFRAGGRGGQSVNTTDSAVRITHLPTNITVAIQNERSQLQNKETAMKIIRSKLAQLAAEQHQDKIAELKGPNTEAAWGNQIRNYVMHPYTLVKDTRTGHETSSIDDVLSGQIDDFIDAYLTTTE